MNYIVSGEDVTQAIYDFNKSKNISLHEILLKSKQPVELIDSGEVTGFYVNSNESSGRIYLKSEMGNNFLYMSNQNVMQYQGTNIKIYILKE